MCLLSGAVEFILEFPEGNRHVQLHGVGSFVLVPKGTWHTARTGVESRLLFITAGEGTMHRQAER